MKGFENRIKLFILRNTILIISIVNIQPPYSLARFNYVVSEYINQNNAKAVIKEIKDIEKISTIISVALIRTIKESIYN